MNQSRQFQLVIECVLTNKPVYIRDTGVRVRITRLEKANRSKYFKMKTATCEIMFDAGPSYKSLLLCDTYQLRDQASVLGSPQKLSIIGQIKIINLSHRPFETKSSKALYDPAKKD